MNSKHSKSGSKRVYYPLFLDVTGRKCLVIGGGRVAERKVTMLLESGAEVTLISPVTTKALKALTSQGRIRYLQRTCTPDDFDAAVLIFTCTNNTSVNKTVKKEAARKGIPVNVADNPGLCDFIVPSIIRKGDVTIAISTSGKLPLLSKQLRQKIEDVLTDDYLEYARILSKFREYVLRTIESSRKRETIMRNIGKKSVQEIIRTGITRLTRGIS